MDPGTEWATGPPFYRFAYRAGHGLVRTLCRVRADGADRVPREGPVLLAVNHLSVLDPLVVGVSLPRPVHWLAKKEVFTPTWGWMFRAGGVVPVDREARGGNAEALAAAVARLDEGRVVGIYPEGTRQRAPRVGPARRGVARLALMTGAPVVPVGVATDRLMGRGMILPRFGRRSCVSFGAPIPIERDARAAEDPEALAKAMEAIMRGVAHELDRAVAARDARAPWPRPRKGREFKASRRGATAP